MSSVLSSLVRFSLFGVFGGHRFLVLYSCIPNEFVISSGDDVACLAIQRSLKLKLYSSNETKDKRKYEGLASEAKML
jgi:hypothetical protein